MRIKVFVNHIFPAYLYINEQTGRIIEEPTLIESSWINKLFDFWLFGIVQTMADVVWRWNGQEPKFLLRISKEDRKILEQKGLLQKIVWGNL